MTRPLGPDVLNRLKGIRFRPRRAEATTGVGDRRSRTIGPGVEFADYREYQPGDDVRYVDRHVHARHGKAVVRQFVVDQQLRVTILLDASGSMGEDGGKFRRARELAAAAAAVGVFGGDHVRVGAFAEGGIEWHPAVRNASGLPRLLDWLGALRPAGAGRLDEVARASFAGLAANDLLVVVSDWLLDGVPDGIRFWDTAGVEVVAVQVMSPLEADPAAMPEGTVRLVDAENGEEIDLTLDSDTVRRYALELQAWRRRLGEEVGRAGGRFVSYRSDVPLDDILFRSWRREGLVT